MCMMRELAQKSARLQYANNNHNNEQLYMQ